MPFKSLRQARFAHANPEKFGGAAKLKEWDQATDFSHLPESMGWMQNESRREKKAGTKGTFRRAAQHAGKSTREFAEEKKHASGTVGRRARMALAFMSAKH